VNADSVQTTKEIFEQLQGKGFNVIYNRIPISPEQRPEDKYLDEYVHIVRSAKVTDAIVFNCGMGVGRSRFYSCRLNLRIA
jgi:protein-tyrosine phosphatase